jgi:hypothetical protein
MLFGPEDGEQFRDPDMDRSQTVEAGVAGGADGDQEPRLADTGMPLVNMEAVPCPAARAAEVVAGEHRFPISAKVIPGMPAGAVTPRAQPGDRGDALAAGAEQGFLAESRVPARPQDAFSAIAEG